MGSSRLCSSPFKSYCSGMLLSQMNLPGTHLSQSWTSAVSSLTAWQPPFRLPLPHCCYPLLWLLLLNLLMTSPWPSTSSCRSPWSGCSGLPLWSQPLCPGTVCHYQWPWALPPGEVTEGPPRLNEDPAIPATWQALHRCLCRQSCQKMSPVSLTSVTHHPHQPCLKSWRWPAPSPSHSSRLPPGLINQTARWGALVAGANEHDRRVATHNRGHYGLPS